MPKKKLILKKTRRIRVGKGVGQGRRFGSMDGDRLKLTSARRGKR